MKLHIESDKSESDDGGARNGTFKSRKVRRMCDFFKDGKLNAETLQGVLKRRKVRD